MTEFLVSASFAIVPLFIIVPTMAKYIDMKLAAIHAARYSTWEYTAHYVDLKDQPDGFKSFSSSLLPKKSLAQVSNEAKRRFYSDTSLPIKTVIDKQGYVSADSNKLWVYHNGLAMYDNSKQDSDSTNTSGSDPTPDKLKIVNGVLGVIGAGLNLIATLFKKIGINAGFDAMNPDGNITLDGMYKANYKMTVENAPSFQTLRSGDRTPLFGSDLNLEMTAKSGLLTENWGAGGKAHTVYQVGGLVPTTLIDFVLNGWGIPIQDIASTILLSPELGEDSLKFGYPVNDPDLMDMVPAEKIEDDTRSVTCDGNYCVY